MSASFSKTDSSGISSRCYGAGGQFLKRKNFVGLEGQGQADVGAIIGGRIGHSPPACRFEGGVCLDPEVGGPRVQTTRGQLLLS